MSLPAQVKYLLLSVLFIIASINFTRTALEVIENSKRLDGISQEVSDLEGEKIELQKMVDYKNTESYIEEKARNDLNLIKPGEKVYVIPKELKEEIPTESVLGTSKILYNFSGKLADSDDNYSKWLRLFVSK